MIIKKSRFVLSVIAALAAATVAQAAETMTVLKTSGCGCCLGWIKHAERAGFKVEAKNLPMADLMQIKLKAGLNAALASCHTGQIGGYVVEGHVPLREVQRLLRERPDAVGLAVPGMPLGSPGMESGDAAESYDVLLVRKDGSTEVYARYEGSGR